MDKGQATQERRGSAVLGQRALCAHAASDDIDAAVDSAKTTRAGAKPCTFKVATSKLSVNTATRNVYWRKMV
jgi:hypothetical protein